MGPRLHFLLRDNPHCPQKGAGFHLDLFCVAVLMLFTSALGLPWYVSATVISLAHIDSLRRESKACIPGEAPNFLGIREQRLTGLVVFVLTGVSIFLAPVLKSELMYQPKAPEINISVN